MKRIRAYKTELRLNNQQRSRCEQHAGAARYAYNWGLHQKNEAYKATGKSPSAITLHRELNALKKTELPWMYEVSKCAPQEALRDLDVAYKNFFRRVKQGAKAKGFPKFKSKHRSKKTFRLTGSIRVLEGHIQLPRLGRLHLKEKGYLPVGAHAKTSHRLRSDIRIQSRQKAIQLASTLASGSWRHYLTARSTPTLAPSRNNYITSKGCNASSRTAKKAMLTDAKLSQNWPGHMPAWQTSAAPHSIRSAVNW